VLTLYGARFSTNVERVALALAHKGLAVRPITIDYRDRSEVERISGQPLVPVLVDGDVVVHDSMRIIEHLEERRPDPPLFPARPARRAEMTIFIDWFNEVWKTTPNEIEAELSSPFPNRASLAALAALLQRRVDLFADLLADRDYLFGDSLSAADCAVFPFLKYARGRDPRDDELFHRILECHQTLGPQHAALSAWIGRVDAHPRA
jgi:glutathione S-transferase